MKTAITAVQTVYDHLVQANAKAATGITGGIWLLRRPKNSAKEDIVVNVITMNADPMQEGVLNVNIHVPNLVLATDDTQPDIERMDKIATALIPKLADIWGPDWNFRIEEPATPVPDGNNWFMNIRIRYWGLRN